MTLKNLIIFSAFSLICFEGKTQVQCVVDVTINEGTSIVFCEDAPLSISGSNGFVNYAWTGPESIAGQSIFPNFSGQYILTAEDGIGCFSSDTIDVTINPLPTPSIISSEGNPICPNPGGTTLSLTNAYVTYDWGFGNTGPTFFAPGAGAYAVTVTDANGCAGQTVIVLTELQFTLTSTASGGCQGTFTTLQASGGGTYLWSTGETANSIIVSPASATNYSVTITNGTCSDVLSQSVQPVTGLDYELPDTLFMASGQQESLEGPSDFESYLWSPPNQINNPTIQNIILTATSSHTLIMEASHSSGCVLRDSVVVIVVDLTIPNGFSPNGDDYNQYFVVPELEYLNGSIKVWNRWGEVVLDKEVYKNTWSGKCETALCLGKEELPEGTYFYHIAVESVKFEGYITLKR